MDVLSVRNLKKTYPGFLLDGVSFSLKEGAITGFIGRNGAGKSTTLCVLFDYVHPDSGDASFFGMPFAGNERAIKQRVGFVSSGVNYYPKKKLKTITAVTRSFYDGWDNDAYHDFMRRFSLDENKTPSALSAGMKVKYALVLALSHNADLLILDEPTSGLDPVSRDDLLDVFLDLADRGKTILFSTHITSDLDKCAENILYLKQGRLIADTSVRAFENGYRIVPFDTAEEMHARGEEVFGYRRTKSGYTALMRTGDAEKTGLPAEAANLESIMVHIEKEAE